ncbi:hypothetical protein DFJ73DRAFT_787836 [Zopfochytrium polystomum]|nr:hypothetical protein DFJ73DRAFT_787836 [Zopfochytrium polystomum]
MELCLMHCPKEFGKVGYLTIDERWVEPGDTQRRPGLHIEAHCDVLAEDAEVRSSGDASPDDAPPARRIWGKRRRDILTIEGGHFLASNVSASCRVCDCVLRDPCSVVGPHGSVEHLRSLLFDAPTDAGRRAARRKDDGDSGDEHGASSRKTLAAHELVWMTDRTPHEALPTRKRVFRQFFRLVTSNVTVW